ncbi:MAG: hypothetical protein NVSMB22_08790 [Chloroflexota bacterium]
MSVLDHLGQAAAALLLLELLVILLIFLGLFGGLAWGLHWVNGKTDWAFGKLNGYIAIGQRYLHMGTGYVARPFILVSGLSENVKGTARALQAIVRKNRAQQPEIAARPAPSLPPTPEALGYVPNAADATMVQPVVSGLRDRR